MHVFLPARSTALVFVLCAGLAGAQSPTPIPSPTPEQQPQSSADRNQPTAAKKPVLETPAMRLAAAKNVMVVRTLVGAAEKLASKFHDRLESVAK